MFTNENSKSSNQSNQETLEHQALCYPLIIASQRNRLEVMMEDMRVLDGQITILEQLGKERCDAISDEIVKRLNELKKKEAELKEMDKVLIQLKDENFRDPRIKQVKDAWREILETKDMLHFYKNKVHGDGKDNNYGPMQAPRQRARMKWQDLPKGRPKSN